VDAVASTLPNALPPAADIAAAVSRSLAGRTRPAAPDGEPAAVLILLFDRDGEAHFVLTKRTDDLEHHPGQVSLPGGRRDPEDADLGATAVRETHEELGVAPESVLLHGRLPDIATMVSGFVVAPYVGALAGGFVARPSEVEIARVMEVPVRELLEADARLPDDPTVATLRYPLQGEDVWGATARILREFSAVLRDALAGR
jgi:8-oxo-dGTP pyrophosphatase MutT (NUDIX family)